jgi:uncharacterized protein (TIGR03437 family)
LAAFLCIAFVLCLTGLRSVHSQSGLRRVTNTTDEGLNLNPSLSGDGRIIAFETTEDVAHAGGSSGFRAIRADVSSEPPAFVQMGRTRAVAPAISQDGSRIAFASKDNPLGTNQDGNSEIYLFDSGALRQITNTSPGELTNRVINGNFQPSISDDGRFIAFSSNRDLVGLNGDGNLEIFIYDVLSQTFTQLTNTLGVVGSSDAKISGNGLRVAFIRDRGATASTQRDLVIQNLAGGTVQVASSNVPGLALTYGRAISDDGQRIVFAAESATPNARQVYLFDGRSGNLVRPITFLGSRATGEVPLHPTISGDGSRIAFATRRTVTNAVGGENTDSSVELYTFDIPTSQFARVTSEVPSTSATVPTTEVVSSLNDQGTVIAFNFPRLLSGPTALPESANKSEIYVTATVARPSFGTLTVLNGASFGNEPSSTKAVAPNSIAVGLGGDLATSTEQPQRQQNGTFPTNVAGTTVRVNNRPAQIFFVSPSQVNFLVPPETELGTAEVVITNANNFETRGTVTVLRAAPGIFTFNGNGQGEGVVIDADTLQPGPFDPSNGQRRLIVFATGVRNASQVTVNIGGRFVTVESVVPSPTMPGMDEIHLLLPADLRGAGTVEMVVRADGRDSNPVTVNITGEPRHDVIINEVLADPPDGIGGDANHDGVRDSAQDEFVEIVNATDSDIDISGFELYARGGAGSSDTLRHKFAANTILPAHGAIVVFGGGSFDPTNPAFGGAQVVKASTGSLSLVNANGVVTLKEPSGAVVSLLSYGGSTGINADANQSVTRSPDVTGAFTGHLAAAGSAGRAYSPGTHVDGSPFLSPAVARVEVTPAAATIFVGQQQQFTARAFDSSGNVLSGVLFVWQSSNPAVATIDNNGVARGVSEGTTEIRATARGVQSPPAQLTVNFTPQVLTTIEVTPSSASIPVGGGQKFTATAFDQFHNPMTGVTFTWSTSDPNIATIDQTGLAIGVSLGQVTITASAQSVSGTATLNVTAPTVVINEVLADPPDGVPDGDANHDGVRDSGDDEFVELVNSTGAAINIAGWTIKTRPLTGSTTETTRHTFASGTTLPAGDAIVVFGGGIIDPTNPAFGGAQVVKASTAGLSLTNSGLTILVHDAAGNLVTQFTYGSASGLAGDQNQSLTRSPDITGGFVEHTAAAGAGGRKYSPGTRTDGSPFVPRVGHLTSITISPTSTSVIVGLTTQFTAQALDQFGRTMTGIAITFASSDPNIATIESVSTDPTTGIATATVMGRNIGTAQITASATDGTTTVTSDPATLNVTAAPPRVTRIDIAPTSATINRGGTQQFTATAFDPNNQVVTGVTFTWTSSDPTIATVDANGLATGVGIGTVTITVSAPDGVGGTTSNQATLNVQIPLLINEILADPPDGLAGDSNRDGTRDGDDDEFVELVNNSNAPVDISGVIISDATTNHFTFPANTILAAGRAVVVFGGGSPPVNDPAFGGALIFTTSSLGLANSGDTVTIKILLSGTNVVIDTKTYAAEGGDNQSLTRSPDVTGSFVKHTVATNSDGRLFSPGTRADGTPFGSPPITRIEVTPASATHEIGETQLFTARAFSNTSGTEVEVPNVSFVWDSSDTSKATVSPLTGISTTATALAPGSPAIRAHAGGQQGTAVLTINSPPPVLTSVIITPTSATIGVGEQQQFTAQARDQFNQPIGGVTITFASNNTTVATVDSVTPTSATGSATATVMGQASGTAVISATATNGSTTVTTNPSATLTVEPAAGQVLISEFRTRGPSGLSDEFIELYNPTTSTLNIGGLKIMGSNNTGGTSVRATIPTGTMLGSGCHYLLAQTSSYSGLVTPDQTYGTAIADNGGIAITRFNETTIIDQVGMSAGSAYKEGTTLAPMTLNVDQSYERKPGGASGNGTDTNNNANDFFLNASSSNPQNLSSGCLDLSMADLGITKTDSPDPVITGSDVTYTITVTNIGPGTANTVVVTDNLPGSVTYVPASCSSTGGGVCGGSGNNRTITYSSLASGASATITLKATANGAGGTTITNTATITSATADANSGNNSATATTTVQAVAPTLSINDVTMSEGNTGTKTFSFTVHLSAPAPAGGVTFNIATQDNTATVDDGNPATIGDNDYVAKSLTAQTIAEGSQDYTFDVTVNGDLIVEPDESFFVNVSSVSGATVTDGQGLGTIQNDDTPMLVISQIYGGGNNGGATFQNDFVEIFNKGTTTVSFAITNYSVQYASAAGTFTAGNKIDLISGTLVPGQYFLIKLAPATATIGAALPAADATNTAINMSATDGKVALVVGTGLLSGSGCPIGATVADFIGYGSANCSEGSPTAVLSATKSARRTNSCTDTGNNSADFTIVTNPPAPRNSATPPTPCP